MKRISDDSKPEHLVSPPNWIVRDLGISVVFTACIFAAFYFGFALPFVFIFPLVVALAITRSIKQNYRILIERGAYTWQEANRAIDTVFFLKAALYFILPMVAYLYAYNGDNYAFVRTTVEKNGDFLDLLYQYEPFRLVIVEEVRKFATDRTYQSVLFVYAITLVMSAVVVGLLGIVPVLTNTWKEREFKNSVVVDALGYIGFAIVLLIAFALYRTAIPTMGLASSGDLYFFEKTRFVATLIATTLSVLVIGFVSVLAGISTKRLGWNAHQESSRFRTKEIKAVVAIRLALLFCAVLIALNVWYHDCAGVPIDVRRVSAEKEKCENPVYPGLIAEYRGPVCRKGKWVYSGEPSPEKPAKDPVCPTGIKMLRGQVHYP